MKNKKNDVLRGLKPAVSLARMVLTTHDINERFCSSKETKKIFGLIHPQAKSL